MAQALPTPTRLRKSNVSTRLSTSLRLAVLVGILAALGYGGDALRPLVYGNAGLSSKDGATWEGRRLIAQILWGQAHAVLHAGVEERDARPGEQSTRKNEFHGPDDHAEKGDHAGHNHAEHADHDGHYA